MSPALLARLVLALALLVAAGYVANRAKCFGPDYAVVNLPVEFRSGFSIQHEFRAESSSELCLVIQRRASGEFDTRDTFDPDGIVADFRVTANGTAAVQGRYPPYTALWRSWGGGDEYRGFGSFRAVAGERYELEFRIAEAPPSSTIKNGRLKIMVDRLETGRIEMLGPLFGALLLGAFLVSLPLLRRIPSLVRPIREEQPTGEGQKGRVHWACPQKYGQWLGTNL